MKNLLLSLSLLCGCALFAAPADGVRKLVLADEPRAQLHYYDSSNPANCFAIPGEKPMWDLKKVGANRYRAVGRGGFLVFDLVQRKVVENFHHKKLDGVTAVCDLPDGGFIASCNGPKLPTGPAVRLVRFSKDRQYVTTYLANGLWYARTMQWDRDGKTLLISWEKGFARVQLPEKGENCKILNDFRQKRGRNSFDAVPALSGDGWVSGAGYQGGLVHYDGKGRETACWTIPTDNGKIAKFYAQVKEMPDGAVYMAHWTGHGVKDSDHGWQVIEFGPDGKVRWFLDNPKLYGSVSGVYVIEAPELK